MLCCSFIELEATTVPVDGSSGWGLFPGDGSSGWGNGFGGEKIFIRLGVDTIPERGGVKLFII